jgi:RTX calcium-binding nonapeptide repeat (4 copies)
MKTQIHRTGPLHLIAATVALMLVALALPMLSSAKSEKSDGVRAYVKHGTLHVQGGDGGQQVALRLKAGDPSTIQVDAGDNGSADFSFDRADVDSIKVKMGDGNDSARIDDANGAFTDTIPTTIAGGDGNDTLAGGQTVPVAQNETFNGGDGNDLVDGGKGNDTAYLGSGNDTFRWDNGEGSDTIEGQDGTDTMVFNGAPGTDTVTMSPNNGRLTFFRTQGNVTMNTDGVEIVDDNPVTGQDSVTVNDLSGTDVTQTNIDLAGAFGGNVADGVADTVTVNGTNGDDNISVTGNGSGADVTGLASAVSATHADPTLDTLKVDSGTGTDNVVQNGVAGLIQLQVL